MSSCSRFSCSPLSYGAGKHPFWPSLHLWSVFPFGLDGNTHVQHGQPASSQERKCATHGNTTDFEYIYMRNRSDRGLELINDDSWWWLKRNRERVFNDAKTAQDRNTEVTLMWNRWRSTLFSWYPNVIAIGPAGSWPLWSARTIIFYGLSVVLWISYFYAFFRLRRSIGG